MPAPSHVPKPQRGSSVRQGLFRKDEFRYDRTRMCTSVPPGKPYRRTMRASCAT